MFQIIFIKNYGVGNCKISSYKHRNPTCRYVQQIMPQLPLTAVTVLIMITITVAIIVISKWTRTRDWNKTNNLNGQWFFSIWYCILLDFYQLRQITRLVSVNESRCIPSCCLRSLAHDLRYRQDMGSSPNRVPVIRNGFCKWDFVSTLQWRRNGAMATQITSVAIVYSTVCSRRRSKKTRKLRVAGFCEGVSPETG